ncbi:arylamine N-acetyltransferase [Conexibacter sp. SYSU D00693]|uniref:arylamine N-acetyltransferase family protein n=1 Tax=Conexibacter sp. SYSU D00693 TaxID=2812560 RepID=UPI00196A32DD|nr:arylamine N-acetyltransferase [Conexibacter sp. SYSU D00693]
MPLDVDALLRRVGLAERPPATVEGLRTLHRAFVASVPYEDLAIQLGETGPLEVGVVARRLLHGGRGGYCFELNGVLATLLEAVGLQVWRHEAVVGARGERGVTPTNHLALVVEAEGRRWLAEAGLGEGWLDPLELVEGREHGRGGLWWDVAREADGGWWVGQHPWGSTAGVSVGPDAVGLGAFAPHHERLSCSADSSFVRTLVVQRPQDDRVVTLRARTLGAKGPAVDERRVLVDVDDLAATLRDAFGIDPAALGPARLGRLWDAACAQHEAWLAEQQAPAA